MLLAIDTSTEMAGLAIVENSRLLVESTWYCGQNHTVQLLPRLNDLLERAGLSINSVTGIVVATGPGSFNGLRVGISTAKGLALSLKVPLAGVSTLEASAYQHHESGLPVCAIHNAGRSEIAAAVYQMRRRQWRQIVAEHITTLDKILNETTVKTLFCGEYIPQIKDKITGQLKAKAVVPSPAALPRRAFYLAELGEARLQSGNADDVATLQPLYLRRPPITERKHH